MRFNEWKRPIIEEGKPTKWNWIVQNVDNFQLGDMVDIGAFCYINAKFGVIIKDNVEIGSHCSIYSHSTIDNKSGQVVLEKNCKIGTHSTIMPNTVIGENSIVAAYSFVTQNVPSNVLVGGIPSKIIKTIGE